jgi:hypothetical protein
VKSSTGEVSDGRGQQKYDWDEWIRLSLEEDKKVVLARGVDYTCTSASLRVYVHAVARERGLKAKTSLKASSVEIKFFKPEGN